MQNRPVLPAPDGSHGFLLLDYSKNDTINPKNIVSSLEHPGKGCIFNVQNKNRKDDYFMAKAKYSRGADGYFRTKIWDGTYNPDGSKHRKTLQSKKSSADLEKQVNLLKEKVKNGNIVQPAEYTFLEYARIWKIHCKAVREKNTQKMYENVIEKHFIILEGIKLIDIRKMHFQMVINNALEKPRTCKQIALTFKQVIRSAIQDKYLPAQAYTDICENINLPKYTPTEKRGLYPQEIEAMKTAKLSSRERAFVYIIYGCGLRRGEVLALDKDMDIDLKHSRLTVRRSVEFDVNNPSFKAPKSVNGHRTIPMPDFLTDYLKVYIPTLKGQYLISKQDGSLMTKSSYDKMWKSITEKMNIAAGGTKHLKVIYGFTAHTFRHNYCTNLCYQIPNISIKKIAQLMGDTEAVVLKIYNHIKDEKENVEEVVNSAMAL